jgi:hypothetical protein
MALWIGLILAALVVVGLAVLWFRRYRARRAPDFLNFVPPGDQPDADPMAWRRGGCGGQEGLLD